MGGKLGTIFARAYAKWDNIPPTEMVQQMMQFVPQ